MRGKTFVLKTVLLVFSIQILPYCSALAASGGKIKTEKIPLLQQTVIGSTVFQPVKFETREQACDRYAKATVEQLDWLKKMKCGAESKPYGNSEVLVSYNLEYNDCMNYTPRRLGEKEFDLADIEKNISKRQKEIAVCICAPYAKSAVNQNEENLSKECKYSGPRWKSDYYHHYNWCARGGGGIITLGSYERFELERENELVRCVKPLTPVNLKPYNSQSNIGKRPTFSWVDPGEGKHEQAKTYSLEVYANGKKIGTPHFIFPKWKMPAGVLSYSDLVRWKVKGRNEFGDSPWSKEVVFQVKADPSSPPPQEPPTSKKKTTLRGKLQSPHSGIRYYVAQMSISQATLLSIYNKNLGLGKQWIVQIIKNGSTSQDCGSPGKTINIDPGSTNTQLKGTSLYNFAMGFCLSTSDKLTEKQNLPMYYELKIEYEKK